MYCIALSVDEYSLMFDPFNILDYIFNSNIMTWSNDLSRKHWPSTRQFIRLIKSAQLENKIFLINFISGNCHFVK